MTPRPRRRLRKASLVELFDCRIWLSSHVKIYRLDWKRRRRRGDQRPASLQYRAPIMRYLSVHTVCVGVLYRYWQLLLCDIIIMFREGRQSIIIFGNRKQTAKQVVNYLSASAIFNRKVHPKLQKLFCSAVHSERLAALADEEVGSSSARQNGIISNEGQCEFYVQKPALRVLLPASIVGLHNKFSCRRRHQLTQLVADAPLA